MPVELTSEILHLALEDIEDPVLHCEQLTTIQLVCNTFLKIVIGSSRFWTRIDSRMGPSQIDMRLVRNNSVLLQFQLHAHHTGIGRPHLRQTLSIIKAHIHRFETAVVSIYVDQMVENTTNIESIPGIAGWS